MPILNDNTDDMEQHKAASGFKFSATKISNLGATEYTLVSLAVDKSGSVQLFGQDIEAATKTVMESLRLSPRADNLMARVLTFNHQLHEVHGFRELSNCHESLYSGIIDPGGMTSLYDTAVSSFDALATYGKALLQQDYAVNACAYIITDGQDEGSTFGLKDVRAAVDRAMESESLESLQSVLIGVNVTNPRVGEKLLELKEKGGLTQYIELKDASKKTLAKLVGFISKSVSSSSQAIGTGAASQPIQW